MSSRFKASLTTGDGELPCLVHFQPKSRHKRFVMVEIDALQHFIMEKELSGNEWKIFLYMIVNMDYENVCAQSQTQIANALKMNVVLVNRAIKKLLGMDAIRISIKVGNVAFYMIDPDLTNRTRPSQLTIVHHKWEQATKGVKS